VSSAATSKCDPDEWAPSPTCKIERVGDDSVCRRGHHNKNLARSANCPMRRRPCVTVLTENRRPSVGGGKAVLTRRRQTMYSGRAGRRQRRTAFRVTNGKSNTKTIHFPGHYVVCEWNIVKNLCYYQLYQTNFDFVRHGGSVWLPSWTLRRGQFYAVTVPWLPLFVGCGTRGWQEPINLLVLLRRRFGCFFFNIQHFLLKFPKFVCLYVYK